jgi:hypothetical protein
VVEMKLVSKDLWRERIVCVATRLRNWPSGFRNLIGARYWPKLSPYKWTPEYLPRVKRPGLYNDL